MNALRVFFLDGFLAYRALFRWLRPSIFIPTVIGGEAFLLLVFLEIGRYVGTNPPSYYAIGNAVYAGALPALFATAMCVSGDRYGGTLGAVLASPARRLLVLGGRVVPAAAMGMFTSLTMLVLIRFIADVRIPADNLAPTIGAVFLSMFSCGSLGLLLGAVALRLRDELFVANLASYALRLFAGVNFSIVLFPWPVQEFAQLLPMTHGIEAARRAIDGAPVIDLLVREAVTGLVLLVLASLLLLWLERLARRHATVELS